MDSRKAVLRAREKNIVIPAFNVVHLPMLEAVAKAIVDENSVAMVQIARIEWEKMGSGSIEETAKEYRRCENADHTILHLDHVPVVDEDNERVDYKPIIERAIDAGYQSVMIDGSRLSLEENIAVTLQITEMAHNAGIPCEAELGAVMGHESGPMPPYEEIFTSKMGFTSVDEAKRFVLETGVDWLSIAAGNIHGAVAAATRNEKKPEARLDISQIEALYQATNVPLVLHGGSGIKNEFIKAAIVAGIAKINIGTEIRQTYEKGLAESGGNVDTARQSLYEKTRIILSDSLGIKNSRTQLFE